MLTSLPQFFWLVGYNISFLRLEQIKTRAQTKQFMIQLLHTKSSSIDEYHIKIKVCVNLLAFIGVPLSTKDHIEVIFYGLPSDYDLFQPIWGMMRLQLQRFINEKNHDMICWLQEALYGLKQWSHASFKILHQGVLALCLSSLTHHCS